MQNKLGVNVLEQYKSNEQCQQLVKCTDEITPSILHVLYRQNIIFAVLLS
jgi:hypothetical protein